MKLLIKQKVFSWTDSYNVYGEDGNERYFVKAKFLALGHQLHIYDANNNEIGIIQQKLFTLLPTFEIIIENRVVGRIRKKISFFKPKYEVDFNNWYVEGNFLGWEYDVYCGGNNVIHITKELFHWGDTYVIDFSNPSDELAGLMLVIAIDAANCTEN